VKAADGRYWKTDYRYFDQYSLAEIEVDGIYGKLQNADKADKTGSNQYQKKVNLELNTNCWLILKAWNSLLNLKL
jgi:hypothetical protein